MLASLAKRKLTLPLHSAHITLLLSSMSLFVPANEVYKTYFGTSPPSRATVAVPLPAGQRVKLEVVGYDDTPGANSSSSSPLSTKVGGRQALHVQSLSYWAPANIGPYSQAVIVSFRSTVMMKLTIGRFADTARWANPANTCLPHPSPTSIIKLAIHSPSSFSDPAR